MADSIIQKQQHATNLFDEMSFRVFCAQYMQSCGSDAARIRDIVDNQTLTSEYVKFLTLVVYLLSAEA